MSLDITVTANLYWYLYIYISIYIDEKVVQNFENGFLP